MLALPPFIQYSILTLVWLVTFAATVLVKPKVLEFDPSSQFVDPEVFAELVTDREPTLATDLPKGKIPEYSADEFTYVSVEDAIRQWKLLAGRAYVYNAEKLVHSRRITSYLYDSDGDITVVTGQEGKFLMNQRDLEVFGGVKTVLSDGFTIYSEYLKYLPKTKTIVIPEEYLVRGIGKEENGKRIAFRSKGLTHWMDDSRVLLPRDVRFTMETLPSFKDPNGDITVVISDRCVIFRDRQIAGFSMYPSRPLAQQFVEINQEKIFTKSRRAELNYGDFSSLIHYMVAFDDVFIQELPDPDPSSRPLTELDASAKSAPIPLPTIRPNPTIRYATAGRADFDTDRDRITLTILPQIYENKDTTTGDFIVLHKETGVIEVEHSNSFSAGSKGKTQ